MDTGDSTDLAKIQARREKHKARGINGNGFGMSLGEASRTWHAPRANDAEKRGDVADDPRNGLMGQVHHWMGPRAGENEESLESFQARRMRMSPAERMGSTGTLSIQVQQWSAPKASDGEKGGPNQRGTKGDIPLPSQAANWPAPATRDHKGSSEGSIIRQDGKSRSDMLDYAAEQFFHPPSSQDRPIAGGSMSSTDGPNSNQPSAKRKLNPIFVEALMRWPTGLSGFERQETAWTRWWALMPSFVLALCSQKPERQGTLL